VQNGDLILKFRALTNEDSTSEDSTSEPRVLFRGGVLVDVRSLWRPLALSLSGDKELPSTADPTRTRSAHSDGAGPHSGHDLISVW